MKDLGPGDPVYGLTDFPRDGAAAEYVAVRAANLALKPRSIDHIHSAAVTLSGLTAWQALFTHAGLERGQKVLIQGGAGGVGVFAVQLAHWKGAHVITTSSGANLDFLRGLGADETIDYTKTRVEDQLRDVDVVLDAVGGDTVRAFLASAAQGRRHGVGGQADSRERAWRTRCPRRLLHR